MRYGNTIKHGALEVLAMECLSFAFFGYMDSIFSNSEKLVNYDSVQHIGRQPNGSLLSTWNSKIEVEDIVVAYFRVLLLRIVYHWWTMLNSGIESYFRWPHKEAGDAIQVRIGPDTSA